MNNNRTGRPIAGGLVFTDEFDKSKVFEYSNFYLKNIDRRFPSIIGDIYNKSWTIYCDITLSDKDKQNIFYIFTDHFGRFGDISLDFVREEVGKLVFKVDDSYRKESVFVIIKDITDLKVCCTIDYESRYMSMWINNQHVVARNIKLYKFPPASPSVVLFNKFGDIRINECAGWFEEKNDQFSLKTKRLLTI